MKIPPPTGCQTVEKGMFMTKKRISQKIRKRKLTNALSWLSFISAGLTGCLSASILARNPLDDNGAALIVLAVSFAYLVFWEMVQILR